jgi:protein AFG1
LISFGSSSAKKQNKDEAKKFTDSPKGLYLYGGVGCGKTMLMDLFHDACNISRKKRVHFHAFMLDIHKSKFSL